MTMATAPRLRPAPRNPDKRVDVPRHSEETSDVDAKRCGRRCHACRCKRGERSSTGGGLPEAPTTKTTTMQPPLFPPSGPDYQPVVTLNGWTLPWRMNGEWKEFHLVAEPVHARVRARHDGASLGL